MRMMLGKSGLRCKRVECVGLAPISRYNPLRSLHRRGEIAKIHSNGFKTMLRKRAIFLRRWYFAVQDLSYLPFRALSMIGIHVGSKMVVMAEKPPG